MVYRDNKMLTTISYYYQHPFSFLWHLLYVLMKSHSEQTWTLTLRKPCEFLINGKVIYLVILWLLLFNIYWIHAHFIVRDRNNVKVLLHKLLPIVLSFVCTCHIFNTIWFLISQTSVQNRSQHSNYSVLLLVGIWC